MLRNIVFDIGNVLVDYRLKEFLAEKGFDGPMIRRILKASILSPYWDAFERDELSEDEVVEAFLTIDPEIGEELNTAYRDIHGMLTMRDYAIPLIRDLKAAGLGVYCLSNYSRKAYNECADSIAFLPYTDGSLLSFQAHLSKPNPEMYRMFLTQFNLRAEECVFIDDTPENVTIANELGFTGIVFTSLPDLMEKLNTLNVFRG